MGIMTAIGHKELKSDFPVSDFNDYDFALCILIEGVSRYLIFCWRPPVHPRWHWALCFWLPVR